MLCASAPGNYAAHSGCGESTWIIVGTVFTIVCDFLEAFAITITIMCASRVARQFLQYLIIPPMGIAKIAGKVAKVGGQLSIFEFVGELAAEGVLMYYRFKVVVHSHFNWK